MKKTLSLLLTLGLALMASAERFTATQGSSITISGTSTLHEWTMTGTTIRGEISATPNAPAKAVVTIPVTSIKSEHEKMDKLMADALKANRHPEIRFELTETTPIDTTVPAFTLKTRGKLTIAGVTKDIALDVQGTKTADGRYALTGQAPLKMTAFGIKPPTAMLNTIKTGDDVKVVFRWIVEAAK